MRLFINPISYLFWALLLLTVPIDWLIAAALAALIHELCHIGMILVLGGRITHMTLSPNRAEIHTGPLDETQELICALAGPVGSFSLVMLSRWLPKTAFCGVIQGLFNLLPIYPLDGGRALRCCLTLMGRKKPCKEEQFHVQ